MPNKMIFIKFALLVGMLILMTNRLFGQDVQELITNLNSAKNEFEQVIILKQIGAYYQKQEVYPKAIEYFQQALSLEQKVAMSENKQMQTHQSIAYCYYQQKNYPQAISEYELVLNFQKQKASPNEQRNTLNELSFLHKISKNYPKALEYNLEIAQISLSLNDIANAMNAYNNMAFLHKEMGESSKAIATYQRAISLGKQAEVVQKKTQDNAFIFINLGVTHSYLGNYKEANQYFSEALNAYKKQENRPKQAQTYNYMAANQYINSRFENAIDRALKAVAIAEALNEEKILLESYQILAEAYQQNGDYALSQQYLKLQQELKEKLVEAERKMSQKNLEEQIEIEKKENEIKSLLAEKEKQLATLNQLELEKQNQTQELKLKENQLALLKQNQELQASAIQNQQLEKNRIQQLLEITRQKALTDMQKQEAERQKLLADNERIEREKSDSEKKQAQQAQQAQQKQLQQEQSLRQQEQSLRYYGYGFLGLVFIVAIVLLISFVNARKTTKRLREQNRIIEEKSVEILTQNEELYQNQEEILAQRESIAEKNRQLESRSRQITQSIKAANSIQQAILPYQEKLDELLKDYFIIYRPKDVVSGDFYWLNKVGEKTIFIAADCTGHGVPGAFMTLIGNTLLDKIIRVWEITSPIDILSRLHEEVQIVLRQRETKNYSDGMDMVIVSYEEVGDQKIQLAFAGAKNNLYYNTPQDSTIQCIRGSRKSIGGNQNNKILYENHELTLPKGSFLYFGSDGLQDQNDINRTRFSERKLVGLLQENCHLPLSIQQENIEKILDDYMEGTEQRDDILWVGMRV